MIAFQLLFIQYLFGSIDKIKFTDSHNFKAFMFNGF